MGKLLKNNKGLTLMELLVVIAVFSILFLAIVMFVVPTMNMFVKTRDIAEAKAMANLVMDYIEGSVYSTDVLELRDYTTDPTAISDAAYDADDSKQFYLLSVNGGGALELFKEGESSRSDAISQGITAGYNANISFAKRKADSKVLMVSIEVFKTGGIDPLFKLEKDIYLTNMLGTASIIGDETDEILFYRPDGSEFISPP